MSRRKIEIDVSQVEALAGRGLTEREICHVIGISQDTLTNRKKSSPCIADAINRGRSKAHAVIANALFELAKSGNLGAIVWYEKTRCGMTEDMELRAKIERLEGIIHSFEQTMPQ